MYYLKAFGALLLVLCLNKCTIVEGLTTTTTGNPGTKDDQPVSKEPNQTSRNRNINRKDTSRISYVGKDGILIENYVIDQNQGNGIDIRNSRNITIRNCVIKNAVGFRGIYLRNVRNVKIENCKIEDCKMGIQFWLSKYGNLMVRNNRFKNIGRGKKERNCLQLVDCKGPNIKFIENSFQNFANSPAIWDDVINVYNSYGTSDSFIEISRNKIRNDGDFGPNGGGIVLGDDGGRYIKAEDNIMVNPSSYGIGLVPEGPMSNNYIVRRNQIFGEKKNYYSKKNQLQVKSNVGIYNYVCGHVVIAFNKVNFRRHDNQANHIFIAPRAKNCQNVNFKVANNTSSAPFGKDLLPTNIVD